MPFYFFDSEEFDDPVTLIAPNYNLLSLVNGLNQLATYSIQINEAETYDSFLSYQSPKTEAFISSENPFISIEGEGKSGTLMRVNFEQDSRFLKIERKVYSIMDLISDMGGFMEVLIFCAAIFVHFFAKKIYTMSLLSMFYRVDEKEIEIHTTKAVQPIETVRIKSRPVRLLNDPREVSIFLLITFRFLKKAKMQISQNLSTIAHILTLEVISVMMIS